MKLAMHHAGSSQASGSSVPRSQGARYSKRCQMVAASAPTPRYLQSFKFLIDKHACGAGIFSQDSRRTLACIEGARTAALLLALRHIYAALTREPATIRLAKCRGKSEGLVLRRELSRARQHKLQPY